MGQKVQNISYIVLRCTGVFNDEFIGKFTAEFVGERFLHRRIRDIEV